MLEVSNRAGAWQAAGRQRVLWSSSNHCTVQTQRGCVKRYETPAARQASNNKAVEAHAAPQALRLATIRDMHGGDDAVPADRAPPNRALVRQV